MQLAAHVADVSGLDVQDADKAIVAHIKSLGRLVDISNLVHSYPFCWRSDTPLIYKVPAVSTLTRFCTGASSLCWPCCPVCRVKHVLNNTFTTGKVKPGWTLIV